jgi:hypothetical protein
MSEALKEGLTEKAEINDSLSKMGMERDKVGQRPKKPAAESVSRGGKKLKIQ